jgi:hypothetical protein
MLFIYMFKSPSRRTGCTWPAQALPGFSTGQFWRASELLLFFFLTTRPRHGDYNYKFTSLIVF